MALLLPIRGALAVVMPIGHGSSPVSTAMSSYDPTNTSAAPCPHHKPDHASATTHAPHQHLLCDVCNGPALALSPPMLIDATLHPGTGVSPLALFLSVSLPSEVKPPIL
jgi:hypothetical protein